MVQLQLQLQRLGIGPKMSLYTPWCMLLFLYTVSTLWFAYGYVQSRTYIPGFTIFVSYTSSRRHLILFLYTVSTLWFAYGYVRSRAYIPGFTIFVSYGLSVHILTFERTHVRSHTLSIRTFMPSCDDCTSLKMSVHL